MTRSSPLLLVLVAVLGGAAGWFLDVWRVAMGLSAFVVPVTLGILLALIGAVIVFYAVRVYRAARRRGTRATDPFYATRVVLLAKASSIAGALLGGGGGGLLLFLVTRSVIAGGDSVTGSALLLAGGAVMVGGGLVAEHLCRVPPDDDDHGERETAPPVRP